MADLKEWLEKSRLREEERMGAVYAECEKRGCDCDFARSFDARAEFYPMKQTLSFFEIPISEERRAKCLKLWEIFLQVLIEKKPQHEKRAEWESCIALIQKKRSF